MKADGSRSKRSFDLHVLRAFLEVVDAGSMTAAAGRLGLTQSAVSQLVRQLEESMGAVLIDRSQRPVSPTETGRVLQRHARGIIGDVEALEVAVRHAGSSKVQELNIGVVDSFATVRYSNIAKVIRTNVEEGQSIAATLEKIPDRKALPGPIRQLIVSSEQSGNLADTLLKISNIYEEKVEITAENLETVLEPIILIFIAVGVLIVALSVILPIYGLLGGIK